MKILGRILGLMTIAIFFSMPAVFAENVEWENKGVDLKSIKTVYIEPEIEYYDGVNLFDVTNADLLNIVKENQKYVKKYKIVPNKETADLILKVSVMNWNKRDEYMYKYTDITYDTTVTYEDEYGNKAYTKTPYVNEYGGYYKHYDYFSMKGTVMTNDGYVAYIYIDNREAQKDNINMFERAVKNFFKKFNGTK